MEHLNNLKLSCKNSGNMTVGDFFIVHEKFMNDKSLEGLANRTIDEHKSHLEYFKKYLNDAYQSDIESVAVDSNLFKGYLYWMLHEKEYSPFTVNLRIRTIKCYLNWLYTEKYLAENISLKLKLVKTPEDTIKPLSDDDIKKMLKACDTTTYAGFRDFCLILTILDCGIRIGEACQLMVDDIDLKEGLINVRAEVAKTRKFRQLPISSRTCKFLKELVAIAKENNSIYLFQNTYGGQIKKQNLILSIRRLGEKAGIKQRCTPYVMRHTFATNAVKSGIMDLFTLQRIMGHTTLLTTRKYVQLETTDLKKKHDKANCVDRFFTR